MLGLLVHRFLREESPPALGKSNMGMSL